MKLGPKLSETVKGKLSLGARVIRQGGRENIFRQVFGMIEGEQMLKASQCYLSTTAGPIAGLLFVSTEKVAFCSERSITIPSPDGHLITTPYKVRYSGCRSTVIVLGGNACIHRQWLGRSTRVPGQAPPVLLGQIQRIGSELFGHAFLNPRGIL